MYLRINGIHNGNLTRIGNFNAPKNYQKPRQKRS